VQQTRVEFPGGFKGLAFTQGALAIRSAGKGIGGVPRLFWCRAPEYQVGWNRNPTCS